MIVCLSDAFWTPAEGGLQVLALTCEQVLVLYLYVSQ
jgi:hypothetical protein